MPTSPYQMTVDLNVLDHLGINLYSNIAAVLTEAVANAWDADASTVEIRVDTQNKWIDIQDDGIGMTIVDVNEKYLRSDIAAAITVAHMERLLPRAAPQWGVRVWASYRYSQSLKQSKFSRQRKARFMASR